MPDEIVLTLPVEEEFQRIAHLVLGGLAVRLDLTFEHLEDMQLALEGLLERRGETPMTVSVLVDDGTLRTAIGPFAGPFSRYFMSQICWEMAATLGIRCSSRGRARNRPSY